jgi:hypothetical protein
MNYHDQLVLREIHALNRRGVHAEVANVIRSLERRGCTHLPRAEADRVMVSLADRGLLVPTFSGGHKLSDAGRLALDLDVPHLARVLEVAFYEEMLRKEEATRPIERPHLLTISLSGSTCQPAPAEICVAAMHEAPVVRAASRAIGRGGWSS